MWAHASANRSRLDGLAWAFQGECPSRQRLRRHKAPVPDLDRGTRSRSVFHFSLREQQRHPTACATSGPIEWKLSIATGGFFVVVHEDIPSGTILRTMGLQMDVRPDRYLHREGCAGCRTELIAGTATGSAASSQPKSRLLIDYIEGDQKARLPANFPAVRRSPKYRRHSNGKIWGGLGNLLHRLRHVLGGRHDRFDNFFIPGAATDVAVHEML
jgi:hypothetical protein